MTNEEQDKAIRILQWLHNNNFLFRSTEEDVKFATEYAIKALEQEPKFVVKSDGTIEQIKNCNDCLLRKEWEKIGKMLSAVLEKQMEQKPKTDVLDKIDEIITDALDKSTDQKESQTLRWVLDKISEVQNE